MATEFVQMRHPGLPAEITVPKSAVATYARSGWAPAEPAAGEPAGEQDGGSGQNSNGPTAGEQHAQAGDGGAASIGRPARRKPTPPAGGVAGHEDSGATPGAGPTPSADAAGETNHSGTEE
jgi:hypothetical protein